MSRDTIAKNFPLQRCIFHRYLKPVVLLQGTAAAVQDPHRARKIPAAAALRAPSTMMVAAAQQMNSKRQQPRELQAAAAAQAWSAPAATCTRSLTQSRMVALADDGVVGNAVQCGVSIPPDAA